MQRVAAEALEGRWLLSVAPLPPVQYGTQSSSPRDVVDVDGTTAFFDTPGGPVIGLWKTDGTDAGTVLIKDFGPSLANAPQSLVRSGGLVYFTAAESD